MIVKNHWYIVASSKPATTKTGSSYLVLTVKDQESTEDISVWGADSSFIKQGDIVSITKFKEDAGFQSCTNKDVQVSVPSADSPLLELMPKPPTIDEWVDLFKGIQGVMVREKVDPQLIKIWESLPEKMYKLYSKTPAGAKNHQAFPGGLILHVYHILKMYYAMASTDSLPFRVHPFIFAFSALFHDSAKIHCYKVGTFEYTEYLALINHVAGSADMAASLLRANNVPSRVVLHVCHCILSHHELLSYGSPIQPSTVEAELLAMLDRISGHGGQIDENATLSGVRAMDRTLYRYE